MLRRLKLTLVAITALFAVTACAPNAQNTAQSIAQEQRAAASFVQKLDERDMLIKDRTVNTYVRGVVSRISAERPAGSVPLRAYVIKDADVNAFTPGGGYVFFNAGLVAAMENEAQFAAVVAHEIAHIDRGHITAGRGARTGVQVGALAAAVGGAVLGIDPQLTDLAVGLGANYAVNSFSRSQETDADNVGIRYLAAADYNAAEGARSFSVLKRLYGDQSGVAAAFFASHPASSEREANLTAQAQQLGATRGRIGEGAHDRATRKLRRQVLAVYEQQGRTREAAQIRRNLR